MSVSINFDFVVLVSCGTVETGLAENMAALRDEVAGLKKGLSFEALIAMDVLEHGALEYVWKIGMEGARKRYHLWKDEMRTWLGYQLLLELPSYRLYVVGPLFNSLARKFLVGLKNHVSFLAVLS